MSQNKDLIKFYTIYSKYFLDMVNV